MDKISIIAIVIAQIVVVICVLVVFLQRRSMKNLIENLTTMIDDATKGTLKSKRPDGSVFSDLEVKMNQYLKICIVRNRRAKEKKDRIKSLIAEVAFQTQAPLADVKMYSDMLVEQKDCRAHQCTGGTLEYDVGGSCENFCAGEWIEFY